MSRTLALARLVRLPNVFTAHADIAIGGCAAWLAGVDSWTIFFVVITSNCLYCAGMMWNDFFDREVDSVERPFRPIPSGQVTPREAARYGIGLAAMALIAAGYASSLSVIYAAALLGLILAYNAFFKATVIGPVAMGLCRFANVLLGFSIVPLETVAWSVRLLFASVVGVYTIGITVAARNEVGESRRDRLAFGFALIAAALLGAVVAVPGAVKGAGSWTVYLVIALGLTLLRPLSQAYAEPSPKLVQRAVKASIIGIIGLDTALAAAYVGPKALILLLLLVPTIWLGKRVYST